jgi:hypothetical protein
MELIIFVSMGLLIAGIHIVLHWTLLDFNRQFDSDHQCPTQVDDETEFKKSLYYGYKAIHSHDEVVGDLACYCKYLQA